MRIAYVGRHGCGGNQDEEAIAHALRELGHEVNCLPETIGRKIERIEGDLLLFHKWSDWRALRLARMPKVYWYFDLVSHPDPALYARCRNREAWMREATAIADLGFCTDGDWVARDKIGKLSCLRQGADERVAGMGTARGSTPLLFTGIRRGGKGRENFVDELSLHYGRDFRHVESGVHGRELADIIAGSQIVIAPDAPVTDRYFSNRVFLSLGFGAFLLHPCCLDLAGMYADGKEIVYYKSRAELHELIAYYLAHPAERWRIAEAGLARTLACHTYRHRCRDLIQMVEERLF